MTLRPLSEVLADEAAWASAMHEVIEAARVVAHKPDHQRFSEDDARLIRAVVAMEALEQAAAERIKLEREQQERA